MRIYLPFVAGILIATVFQVAVSTTWMCDASDSEGCVSISGGFVTVQSSYYNPSNNSNCSFSYQLKLDVEKGKSGFKCTFEIEQPEDEKFLYSISENPEVKITRSLAANDESAFIGGYGLDADISTRDISTHRHLTAYFPLRNIHAKDPESTSPYSSVTYFIEDGKIQVVAPDGTNKTIHNPLFFKPTAKLSEYYIGINRHYADLEFRGTGVCLVTCSDY